MQYRATGRTWWPVALIALAAIVVVGAIYLLYLAP